MHVHLSFAHAFVTFLEILLVLIPVKMIAANFVDRSNLAAAVFGVL